MKIVLVTYGTRGDVQPMLALALALQTRGHEVLLVAPPENEVWAQSQGCPFHSIGNDMLRYTAEIEVKNIKKLIKWTLRLKQHWIREIDTQFRVLPGIIENADLILSSSLVFALRSIAEAKKIAYRNIIFCPQWLQSAYHPAPFVGVHSFPKWYNRLIWFYSKVFDRFLILNTINRHRRHLELEPVKDSLDHILGQHIIIATDPAISQIPPDVNKPHVYQTGYWHLKPTLQNNPELEAFLDAGPPPLYAGFGSLSEKDQQHITATIIKAARLAGQRLVVRKYWDGPTGKDLKSDDIFYIDNYPHLDLFPRMAAIIHHGGAGTTAVAAISGVAQIIIPYILDQYYWGHHVYRSGLGPKPIWRIALYSRKLAAAIKEGLSNQRIQENVKEVARQIQGTNGIENAVNAIFKELNIP